MRDSGKRSTKNDQIEYKALVEIYEKLGLQYSPNALNNWLVDLVKASLKEGEEGDLYWNFIEKLGALEPAERELRIKHLASISNKSFQQEAFLKSVKQLANSPDDQFISLSREFIRDPELVATLEELGSLLPKSEIKSQDLFNDDALYPLYRKAQRVLRSVKSTEDVYDANLISRLKQFSSDYINKLDELESDFSVSESAQRAKKLIYSEKNGGGEKASIDEFIRKELFQREAWWTKPIKIKASESKSPLSNLYGPDSYREIVWPDPQRGPENIDFSFAVATNYKMVNGDAIPKSIEVTYGKDVFVYIRFGDRWIPSDNFPSDYPLSIGRNKYDQLEVRGTNVKKICATCHENGPFRLKPGIQESAHHPEKYKETLELRNNK